jgi:hypothetical protein
MCDGNSPLFCVPHRPQMIVGIGAAQVVEGARQLPVALVDEGKDFQETVVIVVGAVGRGGADLPDDVAAEALQGGSVKPPQEFPI